MIRDRATQAPATGVELLKVGAMLLPAVVGPCPFLSSDVHTALTEAAGLMGAGRPEALRLAEEATDMFVEFIAPELDDEGLRGWARCRRTAAVVRKMREAARAYQAELTGGEPTELGRLQVGSAFYGRTAVMVR